MYNKSISFKVNRKFMMIYVMQPKCHVRGLRFHFKRMLITRLSQYTLEGRKSERTVTEGDTL